jgi:MarR family transcriptional regulator, transcriptional regulator for hemolysin
MESLARRLVLTAKNMRAHFEARLAAEGSSLTFWLVLRNLAEEDGLSQRELAHRLSVEAPTLTRHLDRMAAEGLVRRAQDSVDRRVTRISLAPAGRRMHKSLASIAAELMGEFDSLMTAKEAAVLERVLNRIDGHLEDIADAG